MSEQERDRRLQFWIDHGFSIDELVAVTGETKRELIEWIRQRNEPMPMAART